MYVVFFYKSSGALQNLSLGSIFSCLKSGLEETLLIWYPAAGRLSLNPGDGKLNLWCSNGGAVLVEAVTVAKIIELGDLLSTRNSSSIWFTSQIFVGTSQRCL
ncbi:hypothetical protein V6N13_002249 [Hibiscus sabdariffa]